MPLPHGSPSVDAPQSLMILEPADQLQVGHKHGRQVTGKAASQRVRLYAGLEGSEGVRVERKAPCQAPFFQFSLISLEVTGEKLRGLRGRGYRAACGMGWSGGET